jgi:hypothetical protein
MWIDEAKPANYCPVVEGDTLLNALRYELVEQVAER